MNNNFNDCFKPIVIFLCVVESSALQVFSYVDVRLKNFVPHVKVAKTLMQQWNGAQVGGSTSDSIFFFLIL